MSDITKSLLAAVYATLSPLRRTGVLAVYHLRRVAVVLLVWVGGSVVVGVLTGVLADRPQLLAGIVTVGFLCSGLWFWQMSKAREVADRRTEFIVDLYARPLIQHEGYDPEVRTQILAEWDRWDKKLSKTTDPQVKHELRRELAKIDAPLTWRFVFFNPPANEDTLVWSDQLRSFRADGCLIYRQMWRGYLEGKESAEKEPFLVMELGRENEIPVYRI
ncbi:MAG: hypothetical protein AB7N65_21300 [Vicinamibacterales bacterium]